MRLNLKLLIIVRKNIKREKIYTHVKQQKSSKYFRENCVTYTYKGNCLKQEYPASTFSNTQRIPDKKINT